jgi:hypothetical protein
MRLSIAASAFLACVTVACSLHAQTVIQNSNLRLGPGGGGLNYGLAVFQDIAATDFTEIGGIYNRPTIQVSFANLDQGSDWYVVHPGDLFDAAHIQAGAFTKLTLGPFPANVGQSDFWLGVATGEIQFGPRTVFGWVQLHPLSDTQLMMVENAVSYDSPGIIVGTTTLVPEPASASMFLCAIARVLSVRRRRK